MLLAAFTALCLGGAARADAQVPEGSPLQRRRAAPAGPSVVVTDVVEVIDVGTPEESVRVFTRTIARDGEGRSRTETEDRIVITSPELGGTVVLLPESRAALRLGAARTMTPRQPVTRQRRSPSDLLTPTGSGDLPPTIVTTPEVVEDGRAGAREIDGVAATCHRQVMRFAAVPEYGREEYELRVERCTDPSGRLVFEERTDGWARSKTTSSHHYPGTDAIVPRMFVIPREYEPADPRPE